MKKLFTTLCALGISLVASHSQTFREFNDTRIYGSKDLSYSYASSTPISKPLRFWAAVSTEGEANLTLTWTRGNVTLIRKVEKMNSYGLRRFDADTANLLGLSPQGEWKLTVATDTPVWLQGWGVTDDYNANPEVKQTAPDRPQFCPKHRNPETLFEKTTSYGKLAGGQPQTNVTRSVYWHADGFSKCWMTNSYTTILTGAGGAKPSPEAVLPQFCPWHKSPITLTARGVHEGKETDFVFAVFSHGGPHPLCSWTNGSVVTKEGK